MTVLENDKFLNEHEMTPEEVEEMKAVENGTSTKIVLNFAKANGKEVTMSFNYARQDVSNATIKALMQGIVANGSIFENTPAAIDSAQIVTTETTDVDLS